MLNKKLEKLELDRTLKEIQKSDKRFKVALIVMLFIVSFTTAMFLISIVSSLWK